ncbi:MAG: LacI family transcriptional regulator [Verrucomicrobiae bacterium]|nr:LacI family transcriptional regulator [Verrucomicrobiae bacterium]
MVTLKQIALEAGVSIMTVSKVMRDYPDIAPKTKERIRAIANQLGYVPDAAARSLRTRSTHTIGVVVPNINQAYFPRVFVGIEQVAKARGYKLFLAHSNDDPEQETAEIRELLSRKVDGLIIAPANRLDGNFEVFTLIESRNVPLVIMDRHPSQLGNLLHVVSDDRQGGYLAAKHLISLGHRAIAILTGPASCPSTQERTEGYRRALQEAGIAHRDELVFTAGHDVADGQKAAAELTNERTKCTAIFAHNDMVAIGAAEFFLQQKWSIPDDISIMGYGDVQSAQYYRVPLTTIRQPQSGMGQLAIQVLFEKMAGRPTESRRMPVEVVTRSSTSFPKATASKK